MGDDKTQAALDTPRDAQAMSAADKAVYEAATRLDARGERLTVMALRAEAGGGSMSKISRVRRAYFEDKAERARAPLGELASVGLRKALVAEFEHVEAQARLAYETQLTQAQEHAQETAKIIEALERDVARLHDELGAVEAENDKLRAAARDTALAHATQDAEREAQLTKSAAATAAADNARRDIEKKLAVAERDKAQAEALSQSHADERVAVDQALEKERSRREAAEKALAVAEAQAEAQAKASARIERQVEAMRTEVAEQRATTEQLRAEVQAGHSARRELEAALERAGRAVDSAETKAAEQAKEMSVAAQALEAERQKRTAADMALAVAETRAQERTENAARIERELRADVAQLRAAVEKLRADARPFATSEAVPQKDAHHTNRNKDKERTP